MKRKIMPRYFYSCSITIDADNETEADIEFYKQTEHIDICVSEMEEDNDSE